MSLGGEVWILNDLDEQACEMGVFRNTADDTT